MTDTSTNSKLREAIEAAVENVMDPGSMVIGSSDLREAVDDIMSAICEDRNALQARIDALESQPHYVYIGKDGKQTTARQLEDERDAMAEQVKALMLALDIATSKPVEGNTPILKGENQ